MKLQDKLKIIREAQRQRAIDSGNLKNWRMQSKMEQPKKGKGVPYSRKAKHNPDKDI